MNKRIRKKHAAKLMHRLRQQESLSPRQTAMLRSALRNTFVHPKFIALIEPIRRWMTIDPCELMIPIQVLVSGVDVTADVRSMQVSRGA